MAESSSVNSSAPANTACAMVSSNLVESICIPCFLLVSQAFEQAGYSLSARVHNTLEVCSGNIGRPSRLGFCHHCGCIGPLAGCNRGFGNRLAGNQCREGG